MTKYYEINETTARRSKEMMSFSDYKPNSATEDYRQSVNEVYAIADAQKAKVHERHHEKINYLAEKYARKLADFINRDNQIGCMCPSVMITGPANFPVRKKEKQNQAHSNLYKTYDDIQAIIRQIERTGTINDAIKSNDENAIELLQEKIAKLEKSQEHMKEANAYYRKHKTMKGYNSISDEDAAQADERIKNSYSWEQRPFPSYRLTNNNATINNTKKRLSELQAAKEKPTAEITKNDNSICKVIENTEIMRIQLIFDGKPSAEIRNILKSNGFVWAPSNSAWQRQLTANGKYATKRVLEQLKSIA